MITSEEQELDTTFRARRQEILNLETEIRNLENKKITIAKSINESQKSFNSCGEKLKDAQSKINEAQRRAKSIVSEAKDVIASAEKKELDAGNLVETKKKDLSDLDRGKHIMAENQKQLSENISKGKELNVKLEEADKKGRGLFTLGEKQKVVDLLKESLAVKENDLALESIGNANKSKNLDELIARNKEIQKEAENKLTSYSVKSKEKDDAALSLKAEKALYGEKIKELEQEKKDYQDRNAKTVAALETKRRVLDVKEKKIDAVISKIKKDKKLEDDLKMVGL